MATIEQHRRCSVRCCKLQPARGGLIGCPHFGDHAGQRSVAQAILGQRQHLAILATLRKEDLVRSKADLFKARRIEVEARHRPQDAHAALRGKARGNTGSKEGGGSIVIQAGRCGSDLVKPGAVQPLIGQALVHCRQPERQRRPAR